MRALVRPAYCKDAGRLETVGSGIGVDTVGSGIGEARVGEGMGVGNGLALGVAVVCAVTEPLAGEDIAAVTNAPATAASTKRAFV